MRIPAGAFIGSAHDGIMQFRIERNWDGEIPPRTDFLLMVEILRDRSYALFTQKRDCKCPVLYRILDAISPDEDWNRRMRNQQIDQPGHVCACVGRIEE